MHRGAPSGRALFRSGAHGADSVDSGIDLPHFSSKVDAAERQRQAGVSPPRTQAPALRPRSLDRTLAQRSPVGHHPPYEANPPAAAALERAPPGPPGRLPAEEGPGGARRERRGAQGPARAGRRWPAASRSRSSTHTRTEEDVLGNYLSPEDLERLRAEHLQLARLVQAAASRAGTSGARRWSPSRTSWSGTSAGRSGSSSRTPRVTWTRTRWPTSAASSSAGWCWPAPIRGRGGRPGRREAEVRVAWSRASRYRRRHVAPHRLALGRGR